MTTYNNNRDVNNSALFKKGPKECPISGLSENEIDYKNPALLQRYVSERGRMLPRRITYICAKRQRMLSRAIKRARMLSLLAFTSSN